MVTYINKVTSWEHPYMEYRGLSTDTKPTDVPVNAKFVELDTGVEYYFSEGTWNIAPSPSGDGSGSSGAEKFVVTLTYESDTWTADKTIAEIVEADSNDAHIVVAAEFAPGLFEEVPFIFSMLNEGTGGAMFAGIVTLDGSSLVFRTIVGMTQSNEDSWQVIDTDYVPIPSYSSSNNGQVLGVDDGSLEWVTPSSSTEKFVVTLTEESETWTADKTIAEIVEAYEAGATVVAAYTDVIPYEIPLVGAYVDPEETGSACLFSAVCLNTAAQSVSSVNVMIIAQQDRSADYWNVGAQIVPHDLPSYSSSNNGQVLGVSSGDLAWVTPESGITSWNDLEDKPFYEETVSVAINYTNPYIDGTNADKVVEASYFNTPVPISLYRVGDALTAAQLDGATMNLISDNGTETQTVSITLTSADITSVQNGRYVMTEGLPLFVVADVDNTTIEIPNCCQFTSLDAGTYLEYIDMGNFLAGFYYCTLSITKDGVTAIHKLDEKFYDGGVSSWNDLNDRPFYETVTAAGYNFEIDLDDPNYVSGYFDIGEDVPAKFYRVGDPLTAAQLVGAMGTVNTNGENNSQVIKSEYIEEIEDNGDTVGLFVAGDMPYYLVINNANTTIDVDATNDRPFGCSGTFASSGTYLCWIDLSTMEEGMSAYNVSLVKESESTVTPLPDKYYKAPLQVTADLDLSNMSVSNVSATFAEILAAIQGGRTTTLWLQFNDGFNDVNVPLYPSMVTAPQINFDVTAPFNFGGSTNVYTLHVCIYSSDSVDSAFYLHDATAQ